MANIGCQETTMVHGDSRPAVAWSAMVSNGFERNPSLVEYALWIVSQRDLQET